MRLPAVALTLLLAVGSAAAQALPLGDGHVTDHPQVGNVYTCASSFRGGGARHAGPWIHGATWSPNEKPHVMGRVMWPQARFSLGQSGGELLVQGNGLPVGEPTGSFPIAPSDPAYRYDTNPNAIDPQDLSFQIPAQPEKAAQPSCLPMGMIAFTTTGVAIYSALDDAGRDAAAHEIQDLCDGHPQAKGQYHYHSSSPCLPGAQSNALVGYALDGYPILGMRDAQGKLLTDADLDACHGRAEVVTVGGRTYHYAYRLTEAYPYTLGCYTGVVQASTRQALRREMGPPAKRP
ncbi:MAG: YHYH protein [Deinococcales bacterium]